VNELIIVPQNSHIEMLLVPQSLEGLDWWEEELARRKTTFFGGSESPGMLDYCIWPWFERIDMFQVPVHV
jgi:hypothetical protein